MLKHRLVIALNWFCVVGPGQVCVTACSYCTMSISKILVSLLLGDDHALDNHRRSSRRSVTNADCPGLTARSGVWISPRSKTFPAFNEGYVLIVYFHD